MAGDDKRDDPDEESAPKDEASETAGDPDEAEEAAPSKPPPPAESGPKEPEGADAEEPEDAAGADEKDADEKDADEKDADEKDADDAPEAAAAPPSGPSDPLGEPVGGHRAPDRKASAWGRPLARLDAAWTKFEARLCAVVLILEVIALSLWVTLKGLSTSSAGESNAGIVFRAVAGALILGWVGFFALRKKGKKFERIGALGGIALGLVLARFWADKGIDWSSNLLNWYQQASFLTLLGGLRGVGTRLTLLLALLGGSLATASGKHITIDLVTRFLKPKARLPLVIAGWLGAATICATTGWGFFDHIAIEDFHTNSDASAGEKVKHVAKGLSEDVFIARKQIGLDFRTLPRVIKGDRYSEWLTGAEWNEWLEGSGFAERYGQQAVDDLKMSDLEGKRSPIVVVPERGEPRGELIKAANLVFPIGLWIMALRFILLALLVLSGHMAIDPESHLDVGHKPRDDSEPDEEKAR